MARRHSSRASVLFAILLGGCTPDDTAAPIPKAEAGAWRTRLRTALFERTARDKTTWGRERLDPLVTRSTKHLLSGPSHAAALAALDEFMADIARGVVLSTVERALIQRDLWAIHDWAIEPLDESGAKPLFANPRAVLGRRLAAAMKAVALSTDEIAALPDVYAKTVERKHPMTWDPSKPLRAFLPPDLLDDKGPWVCLGDDKGVALAPHHRRLARGHASFAVLVRLPDGRAATEAWIARVSAVLAPLAGETLWKFGTALPVIPPLTQFAVVRRALLVDRDGHPRASPIVERVELRVHDAQTTVLMPGSTARFPPGPAPVEWNLDGARLVRGDHDALVPVAEEDVDLVHFEHGKGGDLFEGFDDPHPTPSRILASCAMCHSGSRGGVDVHSLTHAIGPTGPLPAALRASTPAREADLDVRAKEQRPDFARLRAALSK